MHLYSFAIILGLQTLACCQDEEANVCLAFQSCDQCISSPFGCVWCPILPNETDILSAHSQSRCSNRRADLECPKVLQDPQSTVKLDKNIPIDGTVKVAPQIVNLTLRVGEPQSFQLQAELFEDSQIDIYFLLDLSASLQNILFTLRNSITEIAKALKDISSDFAIGFGSFVDKNTLPFALMDYTISNTSRCSNNRVTCVPTYSYQHILSITRNIQELQDVLDNVSLSANVDAPEGGLDALLQAAVCDSVIGWRDGLKLLILITDNEYHTAGDGKLAGVVRPNDGLCHLADMGDGTYEYILGTVFDYPSVYQVQQALMEKLIVPVFVSASRTANRLVSYQALAAELSSTGAIAHKISTSESIVEIIQLSYNNIVRRIVVEEPSVKGLVFNIIPVDGCEHRTGPTECEAIFGNPVTYNVTVTLTSCVEFPKQSNVILSVTGFGRSVLLIEPLCSCDCTREQEPGSAVCNANGTLVCGVCACEGKLGDTCQCKEDMQIAMCPIESGRLPCSGPTRGICDGCGQCRCLNNTFGDACECKKDTCLKVCSDPDRGDCLCTNNFPRCECRNDTVSGFAYFDGNLGSCACDPDQCFNPMFEGRLCVNTGGGKDGDCHCSGCLCPEGFLHKNNTCEPPLFACEVNEHCARCKQQDLAVDCSDCLTEALASNDEPSNIYTRCIYKDNNGCTNTFYVAEDFPGEPILVSENPICAIGNLPWIIAVVVVGVILLFGLLLLILIKLLLLVIDRAEYRKFTKELEDADFGDYGNPLYVSPHQDYENPLHYRTLSNSEFRDETSI